MNDIEADSYQWDTPRDSKAPDLKPYAELVKALAEKDREIAKWKAAHDEMVARNRLLRDRPDLPADRIRAHDEWVEKYQRVLAQAMRFAQFIFTTNNIYSQNPVYKEAQAFLKEHLCLARKI